MTDGTGAPLMKAFFDSVRLSLCGGALSQSQVDGLNVLVDAWKAYGDGDKRKCAYVLATAFHETARTMQPIEEYGHGRGHAYGLPTGPWHLIYDGRGDAQLTFYDNYVRATTELHKHGLFLAVDLAKSPELALRPDIAAAIIVLGMMEGWFTGKKLGDFISARCDFVDARQIVNIMDRAAQIAGYAVAFYAALDAVDVPDAAPAAPTPAPAPAPAPAAPAIPPPTPKPPVPGPTAPARPARAPALDFAPWLALLKAIIAVFAALLPKRTKK